MTPYYEQDGICIYHGDCREVLPALEAALVVTDPPYGTGGWRRTETGAGRNPSGTLVMESWDDGAVDWIGSANAEAILSFWPAAHTSHLLKAAIDAGMTKHRCLYMRKLDPKPQVAGRTRWSIEPIWVLSRDGFTLTGGDDLCECSTPRLGRDADATGHPYQKPLNVMKWLLRKTDAPLIVDPFMGSGTTLVAAKAAGRRAIGIDTSERYCEIAANRLRQRVLFGAPELEPV